MEDLNPGHRIPSEPESGQKKQKKAIFFGLLYLIDETPPWHISLLLGFQHYLAMTGGTLTTPFILSIPMCFSNNTLVISEVMSTTFFACGIVTLLQSTFGVRLPIVQGGTFSFFFPAFAILSQAQWICPKTDFLIFLYLCFFIAANDNSTASPIINNDDIWKPRMREIQGAIMVASLLEMFIGFTGLIGFLLRFIGPLTVAPTITLVGMALFPVAMEQSGYHWGISIILVSLAVDQVILAVAVAWIISAIITAAGGFPTDPSVPQYRARSDVRIAVLKEAKWFRVPYPGQWGTPTVSAAGVIGMFAGVIASIIESIGDYYACARISGAPPPPRHAINRGIGMEGIGCLLTSSFGTGNGTTSYSENVGAIGITKVGSLRVVQYGAIVMIVVGVFGKVGAFFVCIPDPILGGVFMVLVGMITAVGISNVQFADMNSPRNLFIVGFSITFGMALPLYLQNHPNAIQTGAPEFDQIITVLLKTGMAVGGIVAIILDNTIPGTDEERGLLAWRKSASHDNGEKCRTASIKVYNLPFGLNRLSNYKFSKYLPFLPNLKDENEIITNQNVELDENTNTKL
ncbi:solute carrier family 23 member 1-like [Stylophora pistillata]|uniref:solute carrier family 23 member 1-like n=1 Tax=Stylophora pistillata TaxID=50429 RepID=UPI000C045027|nr:solute carrier family 23 member 1-like [Stylophora pistillata]